MSESYIKVTYVLIGRTPNAIQVQPLDTTLENYWIPRSLIHGADEIHLDSYIQYAEVTFRLMEWKARELGL